MKKLLTACALLIIISALQTRAFGATLNCKFSSNTTFDHIESIELTDDTFKINGEIEIPLEKSTISCGHFGKRDRLDGLALGYQIVLKACSSGAQIAGHIIDEVNEKAAEIVCNE